MSWGTASTSEDVSKHYYAGRPSATYIPEAGLLASGLQASRDLASVGLKDTGACDLQNSHAPESLGRQGHERTCWLAVPDGSGAVDAGNRKLAELVAESGAVGAGRLRKAGEWRSSSLADLHCPRDEPEPPANAARTRTWGDWGLP